MLLCVALLATPSAFALLPQADAGRVAARMLAHEAYASLALAMLLLGLERLAAKRRAGEAAGTQFTAGMLLAAVALFCTVAGYFGLQPLMAAARSGQGGLSFGQLHAASAAFYLIKSACVLVLSWRACGAHVQP
jgi:hypothetical protein